MVMTLDNVVVNTPNYVEAKSAPINYQDDSKCYNLDLHVHFCKVPTFIPYDLAQFLV